MAKKIDMVVHSCSECPFMNYNPNYGLSYDSGYDCEHEDAPRTRIIDDNKLEKYRSLLKKYKASLGTFFPEEKPVDPMSQIPCWCPLKEAE